MGAAIAAFDLLSEGYVIHKAYTFGQPRVGDKTFYLAYAAAFGGIAAGPWHISHARDPVVHLPTENIFNPGNAGFHHIATEVFYVGNTSQGYHVCDGTGEDKNCADQYTNLIGMIAACVGTHATPCDHLTYMQAEKTILMDGSTCTNKADLL